jgi:DNA polymerase-1
VYGPGVEKGSKEYKVGKMANFLTVYGGTEKALSVQANIDVPTAKRVLESFYQAYPGVLAFSKRLQKEAKSTGRIITPTGRVLPVDSSRAYSALNYMVQSTSRDVTCRGLIRLHEAGFTPYLRLVIHDEILASVPEVKSKWGADEIGRLMAMELKGVDVGTDPEVGGRSWGSLYGSDF